jgi:putative ABC transport system substrate-binding protein
MRRRAFFSVVVVNLAASGVALFASKRARAGEPAARVVRIGMIDPYSPSSPRPAARAFWARLQELGWVEGQNMTVERRWAEGRIDRLPALMADVIARRVDLIVTYGTPAATAAKNATSTIPIVVATMGDPIGTGLVASLARPGGNLTGVSLEATRDLGGKWLELLQETVPRLSTVAVISNPDSVWVRRIGNDLEDVARARNLRLRFIEVRDSDALAAAFAQARRDAQAALVLPDPLTMQHRRQITDLAATNRLPVMYPLLEFMDSGGLMAYGADAVVLFRRAADYTDKILKGARPADLPIEQPTQFSLAVNLKTAKALGLTIPESILLRADEVVR